MPFESLGVSNRVERRSQRGQPLMPGYMALFCSQNTLHLEFSGLMGMG